MKRAALVLLALAAGAAQGQDEPMRPEETRAEQLAAGHVRAALEAKDCPRAVQHLKEGLAAKHPGLYLMAGTMYEDGLCVKADWERAKAFYQLGLDAGHRGGLFKLVAGLAHGPRDPAAALWWGQRALAATLPGDCIVADWVHRDPESYVATLRAWPAGRLGACVYAAGVLSLVAGDMMYPPDALGLQIAGRVKMSFVPAEGRIDWTTTDLEIKPPVGVVSGEWLRDRQSRDARESLRRSLEQTGQRALRRFKAPTGIDAAWRPEMEYVFSLQ